jgi:triosephosphate isomerase
MKIIAGNWKLNPQTLKEAKFIFNFVKRNAKKFRNVKIIIFPPFLYLSYFLKFKIPKNLSLGAQNCFWEEKGAFTGEISPTMLKNLKVEYVILGHSERRRYFGETDQIINKKLRVVLKTKLKPILCIGETKKERKEGKTFKVLKRQIKKAFKDLSSRTYYNISSVIVAYEPFWAIGTGLACDPKKAREVLVFLRKILKKNKILYGGSVNLKNAKNYIDEGFDGLLIGGASLRPKEFIQIIRNCS